MGRFRTGRLVSPVLAGFVLLAAMVAASLWFVRAQATAQIESTRLFDYQAALLETLSATKDAEIGQRGFLLTGQRAYLHPYEDGIRRIDPALKGIRAQGGAEGRRIAGELEPLIATKRQEMARTIVLADEGRAAEALALVRTGEGITTMDRIRAMVNVERDRTRTALTARQDVAARQTRNLTFGLAGGLIILILTSLFWTRAQRRQLADLTLSHDEAHAANVALSEEMRAREASESALRQVQKMESIGQLTGGVAHDFNNMLAIVIGNLDLAQLRLAKEPDRALASIGHAREGAERAATLTARLLAFSRQQPLAPEPIDANKLVSSMSELLRRTLGEQVMMESVLAGGLWRTHADVGQLENALVNLSVNARDAMPEGGKLTIETANAYLDEDYAATRAEVTPGQYVMIGVTDTGEGMSPETIERAFDPFFTTKAVGKGTGLGLSQVFGFVKQSGGHLAIYSEVGEGTTVKLYLPRFHGAAEPAEARAEEGEMPLGRVEEVVLVVEDEHRVRHFSVDALRELGYTVLSAPTPSAALELLDTQSVVTLLFTDIVMPEMDGRRLADAALVRRPSLKIVYTTGYTRNAVVHNGRLDAGVNFLAKPYSVMQLARKIRSVIDDD